MGQRCSFSATLRKLLQGEPASSLWLFMPVSPPVFTLTFVKTDSSSGEQGPAELETEKT